jgi:hypothetical protein
MGALKIAWQMFSAHRHHLPREIARAQDVGPEVPGVTDVPRPAERREARMVSHGG